MTSETFRITFCRLFPVNWLCFTARLKLPILRLRGLVLFIVSGRLRNTAQGKAVQSKLRGTCLYTRAKRLNMQHLTTATGSQEAPRRQTQTYRQTQEHIYSIHHRHIYHGNPHTYLSQEPYTAYIAIHRHIYSIHHRRRRLTAQQCDRLISTDASCRTIAHALTEQTGA